MAKQAGKPNTVIDVTPDQKGGARRERVGLPVLTLRGGPYDGAVAKASDDDQITGVTFFPDSLIVTGKKGSAVYDLETTKSGRRGVFSHMG